eukprot:15194141-Ditylum_brightwellii.AAC.1
MTIPVPIQEIQNTATTYNYDSTSAFVITCAGASCPRVTHVSISFVTGDDGLRIETTLGKSACREINGNDHVTLLFPPLSSSSSSSEDNDMNDKLSLIVDGVVERIFDGGEVVVKPLSAVRHYKRS